MTDEVKRLVLIENDGGMIRSVREALENQPRFTFVAYLMNSNGLESFLDQYAPDIALVDIGLLQPGEGLGVRLTTQSFEEGLNIIGKIDTLSPHTIIVGFSDHLIDHPDLARQAMSRGADALIAKQNGPSDWMAWQQWLIAQLHSVVDGWWRPTPEVAQLLALEEEKRRMTLADDPLPLTGRQLEVLNLMALNRTDAEIAAELTIEEGAVRGHIANIKRRLQLRYRWQVINEARKRGLGGAPEE